MRYNTLDETIAGMQSSDYKERFIAEYYQTKIRMEKLRKFIRKIESEDFGCEHVQHDCPLRLLQVQYNAMDDYLKILEIRALIEKIDLETC